MVVFYRKIVLTEWQSGSIADHIFEFATWFIIKMLIFWISQFITFLKPWLDSMVSKSPCFRELYL